MERDRRGKLIDLVNTKHQSRRLVELGFFLGIFVRCLQIALYDCLSLRSLLHSRGCTKIAAKELLRLYKKQARCLFCNWYQIIYSKYGLLW